MKQTIFLVVLAVIMGAVLARELFPKREKALVPVPTIITQYDTVRDTVRIQGPEIVTTDTVRIVIRETLHDTAQIPVNADSSERPPLWPVLSVLIGASRGDTSLVTTFSLRSGKTSESRIWTPGPLRGLWVDSAQTPRMDFYSPPKPRGVSLKEKIKWMLVGGGGATLIQGVRCQ